MNFPDTRMNEFYVIVMACLSWLMMARVMKKFDRKDPIGWLLLATCFAVFGYVISLGIGWHPEYLHCKVHCFPWGD